MELKDAIKIVRACGSMTGQTPAFTMVLDHVESTMPKKGPMTATELERLRTVSIPVLKDDIARIRDIGRCYVPKVREQIERVAKAAESMLPKTTMIEVWHVEYCEHGVPKVAVHTTEAGARFYERPHKDGQCIRITGPHQHEVPA